MIPERASLIAGSSTCASGSRPSRSDNAHQASTQSRYRDAVCAILGHALENRRSRTRSIQAPLFGPRPVHQREHVAAKTTVVGHHYAQDRLRGDRGIRSRSTRTQHVLTGGDG